MFFSDLIECHRLVAVVYCALVNWRYAFELQLTSCRRLRHLVHHRLAVRMLSVENRMEPARVRVCQNTLVTRTKDVVLSASLTLTALPTKRASGTNAKTRVQEHADRMLTVRL